MSPLDPPHTPTDAPPPPRSESRFPLLLTLLAVLAGLQRLAILLDQRAHSPFYAHPINDAAVYWDWAGRIARGTWLQPTPFTSAPLYPYLLGLLRALGASFSAVYLVQLLCQLAAGVLVALTARRRFGPAVALLAAALFWLLADPAIHQDRILNNSLQLLLVTLLWHQLTRRADRLSFSSSLFTGLLLGLNALANPPMMLVLLLIPLWIARLKQTHSPAHAALSLLVALATLAPATLHNYRAAREFIPIRHAGIALLYGNIPGGDGTFSPPPGFPAARQSMYDFAVQLYSQKTGRPPSWNGMERFFTTQVLRFWLTQPADMLRLFLLKLHWFFAASHYDDILPATFEIRDGFAPLLRLAPLPAPWLLLPAALVAATLLKRRNLPFPDLLLLALPLLAVLLFQYTPRYRIPVLPLAAPLAAAGFVGLVDRSIRLQSRFATLVAATIAVLLGPTSSLLGLDAASRFKPLWRYTAGTVLDAVGRPREALVYLEDAARLSPNAWDAHTHLGVLYRRLGRFENARRELLAGIETGPSQPRAWREYLDFCEETGDWTTGIAFLRRLIAADPESVDVRLRLDSALRASGRYGEARDSLGAGIAATPQSSVLLGRLTWLLATCPDAPVRDGRRARQFAERLLQSSPHPSSEDLDIAAAAFAEAGDFVRAIDLAEAAIRDFRGDPAHAKAIAGRLELYRSKQRYRETRPTTRAATTRTD